MLIPRRWLPSTLAVCFMAAGARMPPVVAADPANASSLAQPWPIEKALASLQVKEGFVVELAAAEPLVADPVAIDFGPDGRLWVADMTDYTRHVDAEFDQTGSVRVLLDTDGDGRYDQSSVFAGKLRFPTDVKSWRGGVIVCDAPDVIYFEDTDGDLQADVRRVLLTGFETHNPQARVNGLRWGLDNWLHGACGIFGGKITTSSGRQVELGGRDFRFRPDAGQLEPLTGKTQQGLARDDWGNWFGCENESTLDHYPLVDRYLARNTHVAPPPAEAYVPFGGDDPNELFPIGAPTLFALSGPPGRPTSICGLEVYRDELLGDEFANNAFVAEPVNGLVHRRVLQARGSTFRGLRAADEQRREFLASTDPWFRLVQIRTGPDGCLYVVDMHRAVIEDPEFIPPESLRQLDLFAGRDEGRILRIRPATVPPRPVLRLDRMATPELVAALDSPNGPQRDLAQELLVQRRAVDAAPLLMTVVRTAARPATRLQALCALEGLHALDAVLVSEALGDADASVRRHAIRVGELFAGGSAEIRAKLFELLHDKDPQVRLQLAYSLGEIDDSRVPAALAGLAWEHHDDPYLLAAAWSSVNRGNVSGVIRNLLERAGDGAIPDSLIEPTITLAFELGSPRDVELIAARVGGAANDHAAEWRLAAAAILLEHARKQPAGDASRVRGLAEQLAPVIAAAKVLVDAKSGDAHKAIAGLRVLVAHNPESTDLVPALTGRLGSLNPPDVQQAAVVLMASIKTAEAGAALLSDWSSLTPAVRGRAFDAMIGRREFTSLLLAKLADGELKALDFDALQRQRLLEHPDEAVRQEAAAVLAGAIDADRDRIVREYASADVEGDAMRGRQAFAKNCSSCHRLESQGHAVGPDLAALTTRTRDALTASILDPNRAVDGRYQQYTAYTVEGLAHTGVLVAETSTSITLVEQEGKSLTLLRPDVDVLQSSDKSLMPEGFERDLTPQDVADVIAYLNNVGTAPKPVAGGRR
jgi:putative membrane-bound dehydrogenase-like protein